MVAGSDGSRLTKALQDVCLCLRERLYGHYPKTSFTIVADTPENLRLRQQSELQSQ
ncbi:nebulette isoform X11, partial [Lates japonicus]